MSGNTFGRIFRLTTYGESHGPGLGGIVDGCPPGIPLDEAQLQAELDKRRPGQANAASTPRKEPDAVTLLSGVFEGKTTGTPIAFHVANTSQHSADYDDLRGVYRPGHADYTFDAKFGIRDHRGGGRSSGRETVARVAGGAIAQALLAREGIALYGCAASFGGIAAPLTDIAGAERRAFFAPDDGIVPQWEEAVRDARAQGDTLGGLVRIEAHGVPAGLGEPVFDKLDALFAHALMSVGAVKGVSVGDGFAAADATGSANNDPMAPDGFASNHAGGILGGISTGQPIVLTASVKPIASIGLEQQTVNTAGEAVTIRVGGRHDLSAIPRIVPVLKAMAALVLADALLLQKRML
ncbi:chorismate synthase [uncultured delta proteobacterium]|uniref:Chorismate synthase n=1 Tax=uncultured delta proteobacterium TaxID=34034 RepID=A0A212IVG3_9DELT|nr:chorismate synthase [uncultured delta proteobacterium]